MIISFNKENCEKRDFVNKILNGTKIHTIREDENNRFKIGQTIQFYAMNPRCGGKQFATGIIKNILVIEIVPELDIVLIGSGINGLYVHEFNKLESLNRLAIHDGFEDWKEMKQFFTKPFIGKLIIWELNNGE